MKPLFDEFGEPQQETEQVTQEIETLARNFFNNLLKQGYSVTDIRAVSAYFTTAISVETSYAVLTKKDTLRNEHNPIPTPEEMETAKINKIQAMRDYYHRTGCGLSDAKNIINELFTGENNE